MIMSDEAAGEGKIDRVRAQLRPFVEAFLDKLLSNAGDEPTETVITHMCLDMINDLTEQIQTIFKQSQPQKQTKNSPQRQSPTSSSTHPSGPDGGISESQVQEYLQDTIVSTFEEVTGVGLTTIDPMDSFVLQTTRIVQEILRKQEKELSRADQQDGITEEELSIFKSRSSKHIDMAAEEIAHVISEELRRDTATPPNMASCWTWVGTRIKAWVIHRFAKESLLRLVADLRKKLARSAPTEENK